MEYKTPEQKRVSSLHYYYKNVAITDKLSEEEKERRREATAIKNQRRRELYRQNGFDKKNALRMREYRLKKKEEKRKLNEYLESLWREED
jgi:hypothetical protein